MRLYLRPYKWLSDQWNLWNPSSILTLSSSVFQHPQKATAVTLRDWRATAQMLWQPGGRMQGQDINSFNIVFVSVVWWWNNKPLITFRKADRWRHPSQSQTVLHSVELLSSCFNGRSQRDPESTRHLRQTLKTLITFMFYLFSISVDKSAVAL